jgi:RNA polymerase sigma-B factor
VSGTETQVDERFFELRRTGDRRLRNELVQSNLAMGEALARRFRGRGESEDDLRQVALLGLVKAVERFDPSRGSPFTSFAVPTILGELRRHFRDRGWAVRVPRRLQELHLRLEPAAADLAQELGRPPRPSEVADHLGVSEEEVLDAMEAGGLYRSSSLDAPVGDESGVSLGATMGDRDPEYGLAERRSEVRALLDVLPAREQLIVYLRFFEGRTQTEIAERVGISQMHVSRLLSRSLSRLAEAAGQDDPATN